MVGTDGVLIASDTRVMNDNANSGPSEEPYLPRQTVDESRKIIVNHELGIAISLAKSMDTAKRVAASVVSGLRRKDFAYPCESIQAIGAAVLVELKQLELSGAWRDKQAHCLIALAHPSPRLYLFRLDISGKEYVPICEPLKRSLVVGDHLNAAIFWKERYYRPEQPIKKLVH